VNKEKQMAIHSDRSANSRAGRRISIRTILEILFLVGLLWLFFILAGRALCKIAIDQIAEMINARITTESVDFDINGSVFIKGLVVRAERGQQYGENSGFAKGTQDQAFDTIVKAETVYARFGVGSLFLLRPRLEKISVKDFVFNAQYDLDTGRWNLAGLHISAPHGGSGRMPLILLKRGAIQYSKLSEGRAKVALEVPLDAELAPAEEIPGGYSFSITTASRDAFRRSRLTGTWQKGKVSIAGGISSEDIAGFEKIWIIDALAAELDYDADNNYSLRLVIKDLLSKQKSTDKSFVPYKPAFLEKFGSFTALQRFFGRFRPWGRIDFNLEASGNLNQLSESKFAGKVICRDISIRDGKFPYTVEHIAGQVDFTDENVSLKNLLGRHGDVEMVFNGWSKDFGPDWQYDFRIESDNMILDRDLYDALGTAQQRFWTFFSPSEDGRVAIDYHISRQSETDKRRTLSVELLGLDAVYQNFPYPLKNLNGELFFDSDNITVKDVVSGTNEQKIILNGEVTGYKSSQPMYDISIKAENVPVDSTLKDALPERQRYLYEQFDIAGFADAEIKVFTPGQGVEPTTFVADVTFKKATLEINQSAVVISDIWGEAIFTPLLISIEGFSGLYGDGLVSLSGKIWPGQKTEQLRYSLLLDAEQTQLSGELFSLLPEPLKKIGLRLQPSGRMSYRLVLNKTGGEERSASEMNLDLLGGSINFEAFPYPLKDIQGSLTVTEDSIKLHDITATCAGAIQIGQEAPTIKINGQIELVDDSFGSGRFELFASDICLDEQLSVAMPEKIQQVYRSLSPTGRFDLDFKDIKIFSGDDGKKYIDFTGFARLKDCGFNVPSAITEVDAVLQVDGFYKAGWGFCRGQATVLADSLKIEGESLTGFKAELSYDPNSNNWSAKNLIADCYEGKLTGEFELKHSAGTALEYMLQAGFEGIDLKQFLEDSKGDELKLAESFDVRAGEIHRNGSTSGQMSGSLVLSATIGDSASRIGRCRLKITDMQVGKLSPLGRLVCVLKLTEPTDFAFNQMLVDSYIRGNELFFERFDLSGESLAFNGSGRMNLQDRNIDLTLTARGRRLATSEPSILRSLTENLGQAVVRMNVTGGINDPQVETTALPVIKDSLQILGTAR